MLMKLHILYAHKKATQFIMCLAIKQLYICARECFIFCIWLSFLYIHFIIVDREDEI